jgi:hypothetical protein
MKRLLFAVSIVSLCLLFSCKDTPGPFKVIYHGNGNTDGFPPNDNNQYTSGSYATVLGQNSLKKLKGDNSEYTFDGWNTKTDGTGAHYKSGEQIKIENITIFLFAVWK